MKNTFENAIKFLGGNAFEFIGLDEEASEIFYIRCEDDYKDIYNKSLDFANRFIETGCYSLVVKYTLFNDIALHTYKSDLISNSEYNKYAVACKIIGSIIDE